MHKSFVERIFPHSSSPPPQHDRTDSRTASLSASSSPSSSRRSSLPHRPHQTSPLASLPLQSPPLSTSVIHHANPLLPVERAAKSLERTVQSLLDAQSEGLLAGLGAGGQDDVSSAGSLTPTQTISLSTPSRRSMGPKIMPVRQPVTQRISLRGARRGLTSCMREFAQLKEEEATVLESQYQEREQALKRAQALETKRRDLEIEASHIKNDESASVARTVRNEAQELDKEIRELEDRLMETKARRRHLLDKASQLESSVDAKLSSYNSSIAIVDMEIRKFLRRPPTEQSLPSSVGGSTDSGMYALNPKRRTLQMANEQWKTEQEFLTQRKEAVANEQHALQEGGKLWRDAVQRITEFEKAIRAQTRSLSESTLQLGDTAPAEALLSNLSTLIESLEVDLARAEKSNWNLIMCCLGAELEALREGRAMLEQTLGMSLRTASADSTNGLSKPRSNEIDEDQEGPDDDLIRYGGDANGGVLHSPGASSNKSLEETMKVFGDGRISIAYQPKLPEAMSSSQEQRPGLRHQRHSSRTTASRPGFGFGPTPDSRSDTEDDDPGPEFLVSQS